MAIRRIIRRGNTRLLLDFYYKSNEGRRVRFRKDAEVPMMAAARAEERRLLLNIAQYGEPYPLVGGRAGAAPGRLFTDVIEEFRSTFMVTDLKVSTRRGYGAVLDAELLPRFGEHAISKVDGPAAVELDLALSQRNLSRATRNNVQSVLRSVLRFAVERGYLSAKPVGLPRLKPIGQTILEIPSDEEVDKILAVASDCHQLSFALIAFAGLRPNEVRALRRRDIRLRREKGQLAGGFVSVREGRSHGEIHTPKTGQREIPIVPDLARLLARVENLPRDGHVALNKRGVPWGQYGLLQAFDRTRNRAGLMGWSLYCLRHYAITSWLRAGVPVHVVQRMAGHKHLSTTQRYVHHLKEDLEEAGRRLSKAAERRKDELLAKGNSEVEPAPPSERGRGKRPPTRKR